MIAPKMMSPSPSAWSDTTRAASVASCNVIEVGPDTNGGRPGFVVADTGPGIPAEERAMVFERFYRGAEGRSAGPGTGLGLAIVAELAERWNGSVELLDGPGTRVRATFPAAADSSPPPNHS